jgi:hypothetical protein
MISGSEKDNASCRWRGSGKGVWLGARAESLARELISQTSLLESLRPRAYGQKPTEGLYSRRLLGFESLYIQVLDHCRLEIERTIQYHFKLCCNADSLIYRAPTLAP